MSTSATGRLVDENGTPWAGLTVTVHDDTTLLPFAIGRERSGQDGRFRVDFTTPPADGTTLRIEVRNNLGRVLLATERRDPDEATLNLGELVLRRVEATGFLVTLGTGKHPLLSKGNAVHLLVDNEQALAHVAKLLAGAKSTIRLTQLNFQVPSGFKEKPEDEDPALVLAFDPELTAASRRKVGDKDHPNDARPERLIVARARADPKVDAKLLLSCFDLSAIPGLISALLFPVHLIVTLVFRAGAASDVDDIEDYFGGVPQTPARAPIKVAGFQQPVAFPMHAKLVIVDGKHAVSLGSPFKQEYFDGRRHLIEDPRRGAADGHPKHEVSIAVTGPAVGHVHQAYFKLHWDTAVPSDIEPAIDPPPQPPQPGSEGEDDIAALQVVRTLSEGRFEGLEKGEKGILEAYLRAIAEARELIYLENQFFTNAVIADALVAALKDTTRPRLNVILLVPIKPDAALYPWWQRRRITRLREALTQQERTRLGVFTPWVVDTSAAPTRVAPVYVHSKVGIVDDRWATVGSANLDGVSLDFNLLLSLVHLGLGETRSTELNVSILNGVEGQPPTALVDLLRRRLWSEHLGFELLGEPDATHPDLQTAPPGGWVRLWQRRATALEDLLKGVASEERPGRILRWPDLDETRKEPREHLNALGISALTLDPIRSVPSFSFEQGDWTSEPTVDWPPDPRLLPP
jgi:phosphatidylserine/phosphatidylglycerophosphate/cardiolipin synthase-like enzyme